MCTVDQLYSALGAMLVDLTDEKTLYLFDGMKRLHLRMDGLTYIERMKFVKFWSYLAELYHSHMHDVTKKNRGYHLLWRVGARHIDSVWVFLLSQCNILSKQVIEANISYSSLDVSTSHARIGAVKDCINLMHLFNTHSVTKPGLVIWHLDEFADMVSEFYSNYQQLRLIATHHASEQRTYITKDGSEVEMKDLDLKNIYLSTLKIAYQNSQQNSHQGNSPPWIETIYRVTTEKLDALQNSIFDEIKPRPNTFDSLKNNNLRPARDVKFGLVKGFSAITSGPVVWKWDIHGAADLFTKYGDTIDLKKHGFKLRKEAQAAEDYNKAVEDALMM